MHTVLEPKKALFTLASGFVSAAEFAEVLCKNPRLVSLKLNLQVHKTGWRECAVVVTEDGRFYGTVQAIEGNQVLVAGSPLGDMLAQVAADIKDVRFDVVEPGF